MRSSLRWHCREQAEVTGEPETAMQAPGSPSLGPEETSQQAHASGGAGSKTRGQRRRNRL